MFITGWTTTGRWNQNMEKKHEKNYIFYLFLFYFGHFSSSLLLFLNIQVHQWKKEEKNKFINNNSCNNNNKRNGWFLDSEAPLMFFGLQLNKFLLYLLCSMLLNCWVGSWTQHEFPVLELCHFGVKAFLKTEQILKIKWIFLYRKSFFLKTGFKKK